VTAQAYVAARLVAPKVHAYFARHRAEAISRGQLRIASLPDAETIESIIDSAFWASLRREEGYVPRISLAFVSPQEAGYPLLFERALPLKPAALTRVAPAVERAGIHLGVWHGTGERRDELCVWGTTHVIPALCFVLEVAAPGLLVVKHHRGEEAGKFINVAVLEGDQIKVIDEHASTAPAGPALLTSLLGFESPESKVDSLNVLVELAVSMRLHGRGGSLLIVPAGTETWRESMVRPMPYAVSPAFTELASLIREPPDESGRSEWQEAIERSIAAIAGLTAVDGATVLTTDYELLAFGATIARRRGWSQVEHVAMTEPIEGGAAVLVDPEQLGGTRHFAAAQFAHDQRDAVALIASQDGRFTVFAWSPYESVVHAHRVESLLL
jgi:Probable sensor domain DACNV